MRVGQEIIPNQGFLERRAHEGIACPRPRQNLEVHPEKAQINDERDDDEADGTCGEMTNENIDIWVLLRVENVPEVNENSYTDGDNTKDSIHFGAPCTSHKGTRCKQPTPPFQ